MAVELVVGIAPIPSSAGATTVHRPAAQVHEGLDGRRAVRGVRAGATATLTATGVVFGFAAALRRRVVALGRLDALTALLPNSSLLLYSMASYARRLCCSRC